MEKITTTIKRKWLREIAAEREFGPQGTDLERYVLLAIRAERLDSKALG